MSGKRSFACFINICIFVALVVLSGCALHSTKEGAGFGSTEERLAARVDQLLKAQIDDEWGIVYDLLDVNYRKEVSKKQFLKQGREIEISKYRIEKIELAPDHKTATVAIRSDFSMKGYKFTDAFSRHLWIYEDGDWYSVTALLKTLFSQPKPKPKP